MIDDEKIIEMFFGRSEQGIRELDIKYGKAFTPKIAAALLKHGKVKIKGLFSPKTGNLV